MIGSIATLSFWEVKRKQMARRKKVSFLARDNVERKVEFRARGEKVSFKADVPSKRRRRVSFYSKE